jgi:hypothetical protein
MAEICVKIATFSSIFFGEIFYKSNQWPLLESNAKTPCINRAKKDFFPSDNRTNKRIFEEKEYFRYKYNLSM